MPSGSWIHISVKPQGSVAGPRMMGTPAAASRACPAWTSPYLNPDHQRAPGKAGRAPALAEPPPLPPRPGGEKAAELAPAISPRIEELRRSLPDAVLVQVDGGIHGDNIRRAREAGAELFIAGSAVFYRVVGR